MLALLAIVLAAPPIELGERHALVGVLTEQGHLQCKGGDGTPWGGGEEVWTDPYHEVGFVRLVTADSKAAAHVGALVVALGAPAAGPAPARPSGCNAMQMRSDWVYGKSGMRVKRTTPPHVAFAAAEVRPLDGLLGVERIAQPRGPTGDTLKITLTNPFDRPLSALALTLHHEGCYGKPGATAETGHRATLAAGERWTVELPAFVNRKQGRGRWHAAAAITLAAKGERIAFDLDVPLGTLGVAVACKETDLAPQDGMQTPPPQQQRKKSR